MRAGCDVSGCRDRVRETVVNDFVIHISQCWFYLDCNSNRPVGVNFLKVLMTDFCVV